MIWNSYSGRVFCASPQIIIKIVISNIFASSSLWIWNVEQYVFVCENEEDAKLE